VKDFLAVAVWEAGVSREMLHALLRGTGDAEFLFAPEIGTFVKLVASKAYDCMHVTESLKGEGPKDPLRHAANGKKQDELLTWFQQQSNALPDKFRPYLQLPHKLYVAPRVFARWCV
jgi:hypothetical protein